MRFFTVFLLTAAVLFSQNQSHEFIVIPSGANVGTMKFSELTINGMEGITIKAPDALDADSLWTWPVQTGTAGYWYDPGNGILQIDPSGGGGGLPHPSGSVLGEVEGSSGSWNFDSYSSAAAGDVAILRTRRSGGTKAVPTAVGEGDFIQTIQALRHNGSGWEAHSEISSVYSSVTGAQLFFLLYDQNDSGTITAIFDKNSLMPGVANTVSLGRPDLRWLNSYIDTTHVYNTILPDVRDARTIGSAALPFSAVIANNLAFAPLASTALWKFRSNSTSDMVFEAPDSTPAWSYQSSPNKAMIVNGGLYPNGSTGFKLGSSSLRWDGTFNDVTILGTCTGCGGSVPENMLTTDTAQTVTALKTFSASPTGLRVTTTSLLEGNVTIYGDLIMGAGTRSLDGSLIAKTANVDSLGSSTHRFDADLDDVDLNDLTVNGLLRSAILPSAAWNLGSASFPFGALFTNLLAAPGGSGFVTFNDPVRTEEVRPISDSGFDIGTSSVRYRTIYGDDGNFSDDLTWSGDLNGSVGTGNFYNRTFSGTPSCSGVADGWSGVDTSGNRLVICIGGVARTVTLN